MSGLADNKFVVVTRPTRLTELIAQFNTLGQAKFYVEHLGADFSDYQKEHETYEAALAQVVAGLEPYGRVQKLDRDLVPNFLFGPDDKVVVLGQDGLVANTLKYVNGQPVLGVNPDPTRWDGKLLPFMPKDLPRLMPEVLLGKRATQAVTMARVVLNDGQRLYAVNDLFIGPRSHTSARYAIQLGKHSELQSSSGVIVSTGLGSSGWLKSLLTGAAEIMHSLGRNEGLPVASEFAWDSDYLQFTVREPFPTRTTGASIVHGKVSAEQALVLTSQMPENGVIFSDGIEKDFLTFNSGTRATISVAERKGVLVV